MEESKQPPRLKPQITASPKIRELYWCDFPSDAQLPEFWKTRPVIIFSPKRQPLSGAVTVIPCTSLPQSGNRWAINLGTVFNNVETWAICDKVTSVAISRLSINDGRVDKLSDAMFQEVVRLTMNWLPELKS